MMDIEPEGSGCAELVGRFFFGMVLVLTVVIALVG